MKSRSPSLSYRLLLPLTVLSSVALSSVVLSACTVSDINPEVGTTTGGGDPKPEMALRLPSIRLANQSVTAIDTLTQERADATVTISGTVTQRAALLDGWLYQVRDDSSRLWVLTQDSDPEVDQTVIVEGVVRHKPIMVENIDAGGIYLEEKAYRVTNE